MTDGDGDSSEESCQASRVDPRGEFRSTDVDLGACLEWVRQACRDTGWIPEKLAIAMERNKSYISRVLNGEKPLGLPFILSLPDDAQAAFVTLYANHLGLLVAPPVSPDMAVQNLFTGLMGLLASRHQVVAPKPKMARAVLPVKQERRRA